VQPDEAGLLDLHLDAGVTSAGLRTNVSVGVRYLASWLAGNGAAAIDNLMEDAATAEISRSQIWQWIHNHVSLADTGQTVTADLVRNLVAEVDADEPAKRLFAEVALGSEFAPFLTVPAYALID
jgi:malate synthase